ncbi:MAG: hypothetical protein M3R24_25480, partial [Chloroflexota bacterium]|nr:hypothetical protein [Chloroflexota bacterium]
MSEDPQQADRDQRRRQLGARLQELQEQRKASDGYQFMSKLNVFQSAYRVFAGNHLGMEQFLGYVAQPDVAMSIWDVRHRERLDQATWEATRLLHNYVASAISLFQMMGRFVGEIADAAIRQECEAYVKDKLGEEPLHGFVQGLRDYSLNKRVPVAKPAMSLTRREAGGHNFDSYFVLDITVLTDWDGWTSEGQRFLDSLEKDVRLTEIVHTYTPLLSDLNEWIVKQSTAAYKEALEALSDLERELGEAEQAWRAAWETEGDAREAEETNAQARSEQEFSGVISSGFASTVESVIAAFYGSISFRSGEQPNWDYLRALFIPDALIAQLGPEHPGIWDRDEYISVLQRSYDEGSRTEALEGEIARRTNSYGNIVHVFSTYELRFTEDGSDSVTRGINSFHLAR